MILNAGQGPILSPTYLPSTLETVTWGRLPSRADSPVLSIDPGTVVTIDTLSHEGILEDQGRDPRAFFGAHGVEAVLDDAVALAASGYPRIPGDDGPHVVTGPGSGMPSATSESVRNSKEIVAPTSPATAKNRR